MREFRHPQGTFYAQLVVELGQRCVLLSQDGHDGVRVPIGFRLLGPEVPHRIQEVPEALLQRLVDAALAAGWEPARGWMRTLTAEEAQPPWDPFRWTQNPQEHREILAQVLEDPDSLERKLVYSDWLMERGDPRGELIATSLQSPGSPRIQALLAEHWLDWSAPARRARAAYWRFKGGFIDYVLLAEPPARGAWETLHAWEPVRWVEFHGPAACQSWILQPGHRQVTLTSVGRQAVQTVFRSPHASAVETIRVHGRQELLGLGQICGDLPGLRDLRVGALDEETAQVLLGKLGKQLQNVEYALTRSVQRKTRKRLASRPWTRRVA